MAGGMTAPSSGGSDRRQPGRGAATAEGLERENAGLRLAVARLEQEVAELKERAAAFEALAHEDPLTGLTNRRGFMRELTRAIAFQGRYGTPAALLIADLDRFKPVNDSHGHEAGDRVLRELARLLQGHVRASDTVGRLGGDEFAFVIWQVDEATALQKARSLEIMVAAAELDAGPARIRLGASFGVTMLQADDTPEAALSRADRAMYARKSTRKDAAG